MAAGDIVVHFPDLIYYELGNALIRRSKAPARCLESFLELEAVIHPAERGLLMRSLELCRRGMAFYDSAYVALAEGLGYRLVSADGRQIAQAGEMGVALKNFSVRQK